MNDVVCRIEALNKPHFLFIDYILRALLEPALHIIFARAVRHNKTPNLVALLAHEEISRFAHIENSEQPKITDIQADSQKEVNPR